MTLNRRSPTKLSHGFHGGAASPTQKATLSDDRVYMCMIYVGVTPFSSRAERSWAPVIWSHMTLCEAERGQWSVDLLT